jgi:hypothetical protein
VHHRDVACRIAGDDRASTARPSGVTTIAFFRVTTCELVTNMSPALHAMPAPCPPRRGDWSTIPTTLARSRAAASPRNTPLITATALAGVALADHNLDRVPLAATDDIEPHPLADGIAAQHVQQLLRSLQVFAVERDNDVADEQSRLAAGESGRSTRARDRHRAARVSATLRRTGRVAWRLRSSRAT